MEPLNVIPFRKRQARPITIACRLTVDPEAPIEEGCLMAWRFRDSHVFFVDRYWGRSGRGDGGRFCCPGDPREVHLTSGMGYNDDNVRSGSMVILGRVKESNEFFLEI